MRTYTKGTVFSLWHAPVWRRAFCARHLGAGATSLAIHAAAMGSVLWLSTHAARVGDVRVLEAAMNRTTRPLVLVAAAASANNNATARNERASAKPLLQASKSTGPAEVGIKVAPGQSSLALGGFTFDVAKLARRSTTLFPFLTRTLSFNVDERREKRASALVNPFASKSLTVAQEPPLVLSEAGVQGLVDDAWARRERWGPFQRIRVLADAHDADAGQVPALLREYVSQNALQPYVETRMRDPRLWTQLGLASDHELFLEFITDYVSRHPGTKGSIELLFMLDVLVQASLDTLQMFMEIEPDRDLQWTRQMNPAAFDTFVQIRKYYVAQRKQRGLDSYRALERHYDQIRAQILTTIVQTAPDEYRVNDARYLLGELHWRRGRHPDAKRAWSQMGADRQGRHAEACSALLQALRDAESRRRAPLPDTHQRPPWMRKDTDDIADHAITVILDGEYQRWLEFSRARLRRFGYELDSF